MNPEGHATGVLDVGARGLAELAVHEAAEQVGEEQDQAGGERGAGLPKARRGHGHPFGEREPEGGEHQGEDDADDTEERSRRRSR